MSYKEFILNEIKNLCKKYKTSSSFLQKKLLIGRIKQYTDDLRHINIENNKFLYHDGEFK